jgi:hypothetical protein
VEEKAQKVQITPLITEEARELLRQRCASAKCSQGDVVGPALIAYLTPSQDSEILKHLMYQNEVATRIIQEVQEAVERVQKMLAEFLSLMNALPPETPQKDVPSTPPVATFDQMYGPVETPEPVTAETELQGSGIDATLLHHLDTVPRTPQQSRWRGWFVREERA